MQKINKTKSNQLSLKRDQRGLSTVEYAIILALVAIGGIAAWRTFGADLAGKVKTGGRTVGRLKMDETDTSTGSGQGGAN